MNRGYPIVLTADRTLTADYALLFDGMLAASQTTTAPPCLFGPLLMPQPHGDGIRARYAPLGLRRIEAALLAAGFSPDDVVVAREDQLSQVIGPATKIIGISSGEPAGLGMNSSTMTSIAGGNIYPEAMFRRLLKKVHRLNKSIQAKIVLGGPGSWQLADKEEKRKQLGVDHLLVGYFENETATTFKSLLAGENTPEIIYGEVRRSDEVPPIRGASTMGVVEISRGCGLGCSFCTIARTPMLHLSHETILSDVRTNIAAGQKNVAVLSEDFFRYGAEGLKTQPDRLIELVKKIRTIPEVRLIQIDHANVISIAQYDDEELKTIHDLLVGEDVRRAVWVNLGVETLSETLLEQSGGKIKMPREKTENWDDFCARHVRRLCRAGFFPFVSLVLGLPEETDDDLQKTLDWVRSMSDGRLAVFPVLYAPVDGTAPLDPRSLRRMHWKLIKACYRLNFRWVPWLYGDNQAAAQVPWMRRVLLQTLGRGQILQWKLLFAWLSRRAKS